MAKTAFFMQLLYGGRYMTKYVYLFNEGNGKMRELLGGKGANLAEMMNLGLPVPDGFTVTTEAQQVLRGRKNAFRGSQRADFPSA